MCMCFRYSYYVLVGEQLSILQYIYSILVVGMLKESKKNTKKTRGKSGKTMEEEVPLGM